MKTISFGFIKVFAFLASAHILRELSFIPISAISAKYWSQYDGRGLNEPLFFSSTVAYVLATIIACITFLIIILIGYFLYQIQKGTIGVSLARK